MATQADPRNMRFLRAKTAECAPLGMTAIRSTEASLSMRRRDNSRGRHQVTTTTLPNGYRAERDQGAGPLGADHTGHNTGRDVRVVDMGPRLGDGAPGSAHQRVGAARLLL